VQILIVTQYFWPENFRVNDLAEALVHRSHDVTVLTGHPNYPEGTVYPAFRHAPADFAAYRGATLVRAPLLTRGKGSVRLALNYISFVISATVVGAFKFRSREFDAIIVYQPSPITSCIPALAVGRLTRAPVLLWTLDLWPETLQAIGVVRSPFLLRQVGRMVSFIYRRCALILGQSRGFERSVVRYAGTADRFRYFPQWSERLFEPGTAEGAIAPEAAKFKDTFNVLFAGNIGDAQDFPSVLAAAERLRDRVDIRWLIVGDGRAAAWVRDEITRRDLGATVHMLGRHALERMPEFFAVASALLVTLKADPVFALTIPGKVQTYLAAGIPILGMLDGAGAQVIVDAAAGLTCASADAESLARNVVQLAQLSVQDRTSMGGRGREYAQREFDRDALLTQLEGWISEVSPAVSSVRA
jgi:colanic acid biosynthesis glycosyl transferase WcaI